MSPAEADGEAADAETEAAATEAAAAAADAEAAAIRLVDDDVGGAVRTLILEKLSVLFKEKEAVMDQTLNSAEINAEIVSVAIYTGSSYYDTFLTLNSYISADR